MRSRQAQFEALVHAYSADVYRFCLWLCRERSTAEDLVQESFLRAWRALDTLRADTSAKAWLLTIARNEYARLCQQRRPESASDDRALLEAIPDSGGPSAETLAVREAIQRLPDEYREPLLLQVIGGFSAEEIGGMIGSSAGAVATRLFRARQKLRAELGSDWARQTSAG